MSELKIHDVIYLTEDAAPDEGEMLWCKDKINVDDIKYIRADSLTTDREQLLKEVVEVIQCELLGTNSSDHPTDLAHDKAVFDCINAVKQMVEK